MPDVKDARVREELELIERYQKNPHVHPLTCGNREPGTHPMREGEFDFGILEGRARSDGTVYLACRDCDYTQEIGEHVWAIIRSGAEVRGIEEMGVFLEVHAAQQIPEDHWLRDPEWSWLRKGIEYASTQTTAIPALSKLTPGEAGHLVLSVLRGAGIRIAGEGVRRSIRDAVRDALPDYCGDALDDEEVDRIVNAAGPMAQMHIRKAFDGGVYT